MAPAARRTARGAGHAAPERAWGYARSPVGAIEAVTAYLGAIARHDWDALAATLAPDVVRVGPYGDTYEGREAYVGFLAGLVPRLEGYRLDVHRVVHDPGAGVAVAELSETVTIDGSPLVTPESLVFDLDDAGRIRRVAIYIQRAAP